MKKYIINIYINSYNNTWLNLLIYNNLYISLLQIFKSKVLYLMIAEIFYITDVQFGYSIFITVA